jgi:hypothetical protein
MNQSKKSCYTLCVALDRSCQLSAVRPRADFWVKKLGFVLSNQLIGKPEILHSLTIHPSPYKNGGDTVVVITGQTNLLRPPAARVGRWAMYVVRCTMDPSHRTAFCGTPVHRHGHLCLSGHSRYRLSPNRSLTSSILVADG